MTAGAPVHTYSVHRKRVAQNFLSLTAANALERLIGLVGGVYVRRVLGAAVIGQVSWTGACISYFALLVNPGLNTIAKRETARSPQEAARYVSLLFLVQLGLAVLSFVLVGLVASWNLRGREISFLLLIQAISLLLLPLDLTWLLHSHERMAPLAGASVALSVVQIAALFLLVHGATDVVRYVILPYPFRLVLAGFTIWYAVRHELLDMRGLRLSLAGATSLVKAAVPLGLSQVAVLIYFNCDTIFLGFTRGDAVVGLYSTAYSMMLLIAMMLSSSLLTAYFPVLSRSYAEPAHAAHVSGEFLRLMVWLGFPVAALGWAVGRPLIMLLYGDKFAESGVIFEWLSLNLALMFFNSGYNQPLNAWRHQGLVFRCTVVGAVTNLGLNFWLIPRYGAYGAIVTTILAELAVLFMAIYVRRKVVPLKWRQPVLRAGATCLLAAALARGLLLAGVPWWLAGGCGATVCATGLVWFERGWAMTVRGYVSKRIIP